MDNHKLKSDEILIRSFERLESRWAELNEDLNCFIGRSDLEISHEDYNKFLNIANEENDVVNNCQSLARFLNDVNKDLVDCDQSKETENNAKVEVYSDGVCAENIEVCETSMLLTVKEFELSNNSMKQYTASHNPNVEYCKDVVDKHLPICNNIDSSEEFDSNLNCSMLSQDINDISVNLSFDRKNSKVQKHDDIINNRNIIGENVKEPIVVVTEQSLKSGDKTSTIEVMDKFTEMFINDQNQISNLFSKGEGNYSPDSSNSVDEDDNEDCISLLDNEESFFSDVCIYGEKKSNSSNNSKFPDKDVINEDCITLLDDEEYLSGSLRNSNSLNKNEVCNYVANDLNKYSNENQNNGFQYNNIELMGNKCNKNISDDNEVKIIETINKGQITNDFENDPMQKTSTNENIDVRDNYDVYRDIYTWDDETNFYIQGSSGNNSKEFDLLSQNFDQKELYQTVSSVDDFTKGRRKRKNMILFRNVCYFNIINNCNKSNCTFPHVIPDVSEVKIELRNFDNKMFIEECGLIKDDKIIFDYGLCFLEECSKRNLSREVVRMAIDFIKITKNEAKVFQNIVLKTTLLHLNIANVDECKDLLTDINFSGRRCLCDVLLETLSVTEHFSDYKVAFIKLIDIINIRKAFSNKMATDILKQICKISNEAPLSRALLKVIKYTHPKIFQDPMIQHFENMIKHDKELIEKFINLKATILGSNNRRNNAVTSVTDKLRNLETRSGIDNTNTFHKSDQGSTINNELVLYPDISRRPSNDTNNVVIPKEALPNNPLPVTKGGPSNREHVLSPDIIRRPSNDTNNVFIPKEALTINPLPGTKGGPSNREHVLYPDISRRLSNDTYKVVIPKEALPNIHLPITKQGPSNREHLLYPDISGRLSNDTNNVVIPKEALPNNPPAVTKQGPSNREHVLSVKNNRRLSSDTNNVIIPKEALPYKPLPVKQQDPNYVNKNIIKRRKSTTKIHPWTLPKSHHRTKENEAK